VTEQWRKTFAAWAKTEAHQHAVAEARRVIAEALAQSKKPMVSFSGGKDSTAMLHLVLQQKPDVTVWHWDYGPAFVPREVQAEIENLARRLGVTQLRIDTSSIYWRDWRKAKNVFYRVYFGFVAPRLLQEGYDCVFVGIRAEESVKRKLRISARRSLTAIREAWPLASWQWLDVWAYLVSNNVPYLSLYDSRAELVGYDKVRFATLFDPEMADLGAESVDNVLHWRWRHERP
jgi:3'-phosphoadenosine 5'-phosphosulfate sulfotransferase (PAPS reductase)/FAD synthetase